MSSLNIGFFLTSFNVGGVERAFITTANSLVNTGNKITIITCHGFGELREEIDPKITVKVLNKDLKLCFVSLIKYVNSSNISFLITGPTYVNIVSLISSLFFKRRTKLIISQHSYQDVEMEGLGFAGKIAPTLITKLYKYAYKIIAVSEGVKNDLINNYNLLPHKIEVIYNAVLSPKFYKDADADITEFLDGKSIKNNYLIAVGRLVEVKNYDFLIDIYSYLINTNSHFNLDLVILGEGSERGKIEEKINKLGLRNVIHLLGATANPYPFLKSAKLLIHTSFSEAMPLVYIEALALKTPIVTLVNKGAEEILKNKEAAQVIDNENVKVFSEAIIAALMENSYDYTIGLEDFEQENIKRQFLELLK
jgi:glycosyltransferase involved in cell wall biosynthesis